MSPDDLTRILPGISAEAAAGFIEQARKPAGLSVLRLDLPGAAEQVTEKPPLTTVARIGEARAAQLAAIGIDSLQKLVNAKAEALEGV